MLQSALVPSSLLLLVCLFGAVSCEEGDAGEPPALESLTDENAMLSLASKKVYIVLFHKNSQKGKADEKTAFDGLGGDLREEMIKLAEMSKGANFGVAEVNVEEFPLVAKIYKITDFPTVKVFRDSKPGDINIYHHYQHHHRHNTR